MSHYFSRAVFTGFHGQQSDSGSKPTTLTESGDRSPKGFGYVNTGTRNPSSPIEQGGADIGKWQQKGAETNESQASQARKGFMDMRSSKLIANHEKGFANENRMNRQQAKMRLKESY